MSRRQRWQQTGAILACSTIVANWLARWHAQPSILRSMLALAHLDCHDGVVLFLKSESLRIVGARHHVAVLRSMYVWIVYNLCIALSKLR